MKKETAVEQFLNAIKDQVNLSQEHSEMIESYAKQAKEMEKEQIIDAYDVQWVENIKNGKDYYNEIFKKK